MITKMKKVMLFTPDVSHSVDEDLTRLGQLGVVHIAPFQPAQDESIDRVDARIKQMQTAMDALENIGDEHREILILKELQGFRYGEIAAILEIPEGTVASRLYHARRSLKEALEEMGAEYP